MGNNIFIKVILTVIAVELGVLIFKNNTTNVVMSDANTTGKSQAVQARYDMPNAANYENQQTPMKVEIVGINMTGMSNTYKGLIPVKLYNTGSNPISYPFEMKPARQ